MDFKKLFGILAILMYVGGFVVAQSSDTYLETLQKINSKIDSSNKEINDNINSFSGAFQDTFKLIDDEISRLIIANAAMVGGVFAIMFLVYAKTTSRTKRDIQVLLAAHAKHIDTVITTRLEELESRIDDKFKARDTTTLSKLGSDFDFIATDVFKEEVMIKEAKELAVARKLEEEKQAEIRRAIVKSSTLTMETVPERKPVARGLAETIYTEEAKLEMFGKGAAPKKSGGGFKRLKRGFMKLLGKDKPKENIVELNKK